MRRWLLIRTQAVLRNRGERAECRRAFQHKKQAVLAPLSRLNAQRFCQSQGTIVPLLRALDEPALQKRMLPGAKIVLFTTRIQAHCAASLALCFHVDHERFAAPLSSPMRTFPELDEMRQPAQGSRQCLDRAWQACAAADAKKPRRQAFFACPRNYSPSMGLFFLD